jgi:catechol 2,3-dioxygenase-like lactoylglutathione lyase family enzyme
MKIRHYGLACRSEETADRFYEKFLGLKKSGRKAVPAVLSGPLFGIPSDLTLLNYDGDEVHFEVFIYESERPAAGSPTHVCLEVEDLGAFLERCRAMGVPVIGVPRGDQWITFIQDYDGNLFEIKPTGA